MEGLFPPGSNIRIGVLGIGQDGAPGVVGMAGENGGIGVIGMVTSEEVNETLVEYKAEIAKTQPSTDRLQNLFQKLKNLGLAWPVLLQLGHQLAEKVPALRAWVEQLLK